VIPFRKVGLNNYYATPNKLFEYSNAGVPVVASDFPEMAKIIRQFNLGRTFDPDNPARIAAAIEQVLADPASRAAMGRNALEAARRYNWEHEGCKLIKIYRELEEPDLA
jgi:glycosyltransferase involved in cell wall biosynthesis